MTSLQSNDAATRLSPEDEDTADRFRKMLKMGMPEGGVVQKMAVEEVPQYIQDAVLAPPPPESDRSIAGGLSAEDEETANRFRKMLKMGMPEGAVTQKMNVEEIPQYIQDVVFSPPPEEEEAAPPPPTESGKREGENSEDEDYIEEEYYEEEEVEGDSAEEEEVTEEEVDSEFGEDESFEEFVESDDEENADGASASESTAPPPDVAANGSAASSSQQISSGRDSFTNFAPFPPVNDDGTAGQSSDFAEGSSAAESRVSEATGYGGGFDNFAQFPPVEGEEKTAEQPSNFAEGSSTSFSAHVERVENQGFGYERTRSAQFTPSMMAQQEREDPIVPPVSEPRPNSEKTLPDDKKDNESNSCWCWLLFLLICGMLGAGAYVGWFLVNEDRRSAPPLDTSPSPPTAAPTVGLTTAFDPIQGDCDFRDLRNPHPIDQCRCVNEIQIIPDDIRVRYESRRQNFIPLIYDNFDETIESCTPRNQALVWISSANDYEFPLQERVERFALATIYAALNGVEWDENQNWFSELGICDWDRVVCNSAGFLQGLDLTENSLEGTLPLEISLLENMLQFFADRNNIEGAIPQGLFSISNLLMVDISFNALTGPVPPSVGDATEMRELFLQNNLLSGRISQQIGSAENLEYLNLGNNQLIGSIPATVYDLKNLKLLDLGGNELTGSLSNDIENLKLLSALTLGPNDFQGQLPTGIASLTELQYLAVRDLPQIGGRLPVSYARSLKDLVELTITQTGVEGNIETAFGDLPVLTRLDLSRNLIRGSIPSELGNLGSLTSLVLSENFLVGTIPTTLGNLSNIGSIELQDNLLRGSVPSSLSALSDLKFLRVDGNELTGRVAVDVCSLREEQLNNFVVDCAVLDSNGVQSGVICDIPSCCSGCRTKFSS